MRRLGWLRLWRHRSGRLSLIILALIVGSILAAPWLTTYNPYETSDRWLDPPSRDHLFGTDDLGRDVLARVLYGGRNSLIIGFISVGLGLVAGAVLGLVSGYWEGAADHVIMRVIEVLMAFPNILLALAIVSVLGPSLLNLMLALGVAAVPQYARVVRASVLSAKHNDYVEAARALGGGWWRIMLRHLIPNIVPPTLVITTLGLAQAILTAAGLSFIGLGPPPPAPEWGGMLAAARNYIYSAWWFITFPGLAISLTVLAINLLGDALRDVMDPRMKV
ncbi:MAG TPA: ABC transporter permease [Bacillota bacterium]